MGGLGRERVKQSDFAAAFQLPGMQNASQGNSTSDRKPREGNQKSFMTHFSQ